MKENAKSDVIFRCARTARSQNIDSLGGPLNIFQQSSNFGFNNISGDRITVWVRLGIFKLLLFMGHPNIQVLSMMHKIAYSLNVDWHLD